MLRDQEDNSLTLLPFVIAGGTLFAVNGPDSPAKVQGFVIPLSTREVSSVFTPNGNPFSRPHDITVSKDGTSVYVVEIATPYHVWKFDRNLNDPILPSNGRTGKGHQDFDTSSPRSLHDMPSMEHDAHSSEPHQMSMLPTPPSESPSKIMQITDDSFSNSVIIMAFLTIPLLMLIAIGALLRLRSSTGNK